MKHRLVTLAGQTILAVSVPALAYAHPGHTDGDVVSGFLHPVTGIDHILAMILVGLFAAQIGGRALYMLPLAFVVMMIAGAFLGMTGTTLPCVELGIAGSLIFFGLLVASDVRAPVAVAAISVGTFAIFHGHAHGTEMPANSSVLGYAVGFVLATTLLHLVGLAVGVKSARFDTVSAIAVRVAGGVVAAIGCGLATGFA